MKRLIFLMLLNTIVCYSQIPQGDGTSVEERCCVLFVIDGIVISESEQGNPLSYLSTNDIKSIKAFKFNNKEHLYDIVFITTKKNTTLPTKVQNMIKNAGKPEYVIFNEDK